ncbi:MAG: bifunctional demethylmenaquinone methyltransferase/2-methoxy-6-polyprenyl-1,4-benzoquinol methylase UbiE [Armatimonadetes bacterium]|nr:bifunctional demethylmenaquinone methyltransferase/2-methoxy-6-polyprenyl-1,4-benzoquinol methylase UbiE [Armatimonadota bacterium]
MTRPSPETISSPLPAPEEKHDYVETMFDAIAPRYDLLNSVLSLRLDSRWRREAARQAELEAGDQVLDVCTGTGDFACELTRWVGPSGAVIGTDFSKEMLRWGEPKLPKYPNVRLQWADTQALPFPDAHFAAVTVAFGIRNVADIQRGLAEMARVTQPGGRVVILEFNRPTNPLVAWGYGLYQKLMPIIGGIISGRRSAYAYLPASIDAFHSREALAKLMEEAGMHSVKITDLNFGTVVIHRGIKK